MSFPLSNSRHMGYPIATKCLRQLSHIAWNFPHLGQMLTHQFSMFHAQISVDIYIYIGAYINRKKNQLESCKMVMRLLAWLVSCCLIISICVKN